MAARVPDPEWCARLRRGAERAAAEAVALPGVHTAILFGSVAYGTADEWSDVDVALVAEDPSEETARKAEQAFRDRIEGAGAQIVWMTPGNGYAGAGVTGGLGREAVRLGILLEDDGAYAKVYEMTRHTKTANEEQVARRQETTLGLVATATRDWSIHRRGRSAGSLSALGKSTSDAGEMLMKNGLGYRGMFAAHTHDVRALVEAMRPKEGERIPTLFVEEHEGEFIRWAEQRKDALDGKTSLDRLAIYGEMPVPTEEDQQRRIPAILETALEEHEALCRHPAMPGLARACAVRMEEVRRAACELRDDPDPAIAAAARKWAGPLERAADRGCSWTRGTPDEPDQTQRLRDAFSDPGAHPTRETGVRTVKEADDERELVLIRRWNESGEWRVEQCTVSYPRGTGEDKLERMKRAWLSGQVTPDEIATPAEREATRRALAEPPPGKDTDLPGAPVEGTATGAPAEAMSLPRPPHAHQAAEAGGSAEAEGSVPDPPRSNPSRFENTGRP